MTAPTIPTHNTAFEAQFLAPQDNQGAESTSEPAVSNQPESETLQRFAENAAASASNTLTSLDLLAGHRLALLAAARAAGLRSIAVEYSGSGDSGNGTDFATDPPGFDLDGVSIEIVEVDSRWIDGVWNRSFNTAVRSMTHASEELTYLVIEVCGHSGYENNEGGYGSLTLDCETGALTLEHSNYYVETNTSCHELFEAEDGALRTRKDTGAGDVL
jgi:hypothetical protein